MHRYPYLATGRRSGLLIGVLLVVVPAGLLNCAVGAQSYADWYPQSIEPPQGHRYPCNLTALPRDLKGIPATDRPYINHAFSLILACLQAKLIMIDTLAGSGGASAAKTAYTKYYAATSAARQKLLKEPVPSAGLEQFRNDVIRGVDQEVVFFQKGVSVSSGGKPFSAVLALPEGRVASGYLQSAWGKISALYPQWSPEVKDSIYHHLCALDIF